MRKIIGLLGLTLTLGVLVATATTTATNRQNRDVRPCWLRGDCFDRK